MYLASGDPGYWTQGLASGLFPSRVLVDLVGEYVLSKVHVQFCIASPYLHILVGDQSQAP